MGEWIIIVFDYFGLFTKHADPMHNNRCLARTMLWKDSSKSRGVERMRGLLTGRKRIEMRKIIIIRCFSSSGEGQRPARFNKRADTRLIGLIKKMQRAERPS